VGAVGKIDGRHCRGRTRLDFQPLLEIKQLPTSAGDEGFVITTWTPLTDRPGLFRSYRQQRSVAVRHGWSVRGSYVLDRRAVFSGGGQAAEPARAPFFGLGIGLRGVAAELGSVGWQVVNGSRVRTALG